WPAHPRRRLPHGVAERAIRKLASVGRARVVAVARTDPRRGAMGDYRSPDPARRRTSRRGALAVRAHAHLGLSPTRGALPLRPPGVRRRAGTPGGLAPLR